METILWSAAALWCVWWWAAALYSKGYDDAEQPEYVIRWWQVTIMPLLGIPVVLWLAARALFGRAE